MYEVLLNDKTLYYPANADYTILDAELTQDIGLAGEFVFKVPETNPEYVNIGQGSIITILRDNKEYWRGEVKETSVDFNKTMQVYCLEDLAWLADEFIFPTKITTETYEQRFTAAITAYNTGRPAKRQFAVGNITNVTGRCNWLTQYDWSILTSIRECIARDTGYLKVRRVTANNGTVTRYIDCKRLEDYGVNATQTITFGVNLLDYVREMKMDNFTNALTPYGAETDDVPLYDDVSQRIAGTPIQNAASISAYGRHAKAVIFDVDNVSTLNALAQAYLTRYSQPQISMEISAIDLAEMANYDHFEIGDSVHIVAEPFAVDQSLYLTKRVMNLQDASKNNVTLSGHVVRNSTLTAQTIDTAELLKDIPSEQTILQAAKRNALNLLLDETQGGYVVYEYDANNEYIEAINICNDKSIDQSTRRWRWSYNGLGFMTRPNENASWSALLVAMTNDGKINADRILTGTLNANTVTVNGKIEATSGFIGENETNGWNIGTNFINNNTRSFSDTARDGVYIGTDGISFVQKPTSQSPAAYTRISKGGIQCQTAITTTGSVTAASVGATGAVSGASVTSSGDITAGGDITASGEITADAYNVVKDGATWSGATDTISWTGVGGGSHALVIKDGIVVGIS